MTGGQAPAAEGALRILRLLSEHDAMPAASIARALGLPRSSVYDLLRVLTGQGFTVHFPEERRYGLGVIAYELGSAYSRQAPVARLARPVLHRLVQRVGETCHVGVLHGGDVFYVVEERAPRRPSLVTDVGVRLPAHLTASGRSILAHVPDRQLVALYPHRDAFVDRTGLGPQSLTELRGLLARARERGHAQEDGDVTPGFASVAVAVRDHHDHPVAAIACTFAADRRDEVERRRIVEELRRAAQELALRLGPSSGPRTGRG